MPACELKVLADSADQRPPVRSGKPVILSEWPNSARKCRSFTSIHRTSAESRLAKQPRRSAPPRQRGFPFSRFLLLYSSLFLVKRSRGWQIRCRRPLRALQQFLHGLVQAHGRLLLQRCDGSIACRRATRTARLGTFLALGTRRATSC